MQTLESGSTGFHLATKLVRSAALFNGASQTLPSSSVKWALEASSDCTILMRNKQNKEINNSAEVYRAGNSLFYSGAWGEPLDKTSGT